MKRMRDSVYSVVIYAKSLLQMTLTLKMATATSR